jgi:hypothetical protein
VKQVKVMKRLLGSALIVLAGLVAALPIAQSHAQSPIDGWNNSAASSSLCQQIVTRAMAAIQTSCDNLGRNKVCYGHNQVKAESNGNVSLKFDTVGDRTGIQSIRTLVTSPLDLQAGTWGLSLLKLQANLPDSLPGQNLTFLVMGDTSIENTSGNMQVFYFTSGLSNLGCKEAPRDGILIRSPQHTEVTFTANGVDITIASTVMLTAERNKSMRVGLLEGRARVKTKAGVQTLKPGEMTTVPLGGANGLTAIGAPSAPASITPDSTLAPVLTASDKVSDKSAPINISIDGCITATNGNTVTIEDYRIDVGNNPVLNAAKVGDCIRVDGTLTLRGGALTFTVSKTAPRSQPSKPANVQDKGGEGGSIVSQPNTTTSSKPSTTPSDTTISSDHGGNSGPGAATPVVAVNGGSGDGEGSDRSGSNSGPSDSSGSSGSGGSSGPSPNSGSGSQDSDSGND